jgi:hypothetical protein
LVGPKLNLNCEIREEEGKPTEERIKDNLEDAIQTFEWIIETGNVI